MEELNWLNLAGHAGKNFDLAFKRFLFAISTNIITKNLNEIKVFMQFFHNKHI